MPTVSKAVGASACVVVVQQPTSAAHLPRHHFQHGCHPSPSTQTHQHLGAVADVSPVLMFPTGEHVLFCHGNTVTAILLSHLTRRLLAAANVHSSLVTECSRKAGSPANIP